MDFSIGRSLSLMARTAPYLGLRAAVYFGMAAAYILVTGGGAGIGFGIGGLLGPDGRVNGAFWGGAAGFGLTAGIIYLLRAYILYVVKAGHVAVLVEMLDGRPLPDSRGQLAHGASVVKARFAEASVLFAIDQLVKGVIRAITGLINGIATILPLPGIGALVGMFGAFLRMSAGFVDEVILAYGIRTRAQNPWESAREALVLYGQNSRAMLKNAAVLALVVYGLAVLIFLLVLAPAAALAYAMPGSWSAGGVVFALILAWAVKAAVLEPFAMACMMQAFFTVTAGQSPDPAWDAKLDRISGKFGALKEKAKGFPGTRRPGPWGAPSTSSP
jgi:hypothetical protein